MMSGWKAHADSSYEFSNFRFSCDIRHELHTMAMRALAVLGCFM